MLETRAILFTNCFPGYSCKIPKKLVFGEIFKGVHPPYLLYVCVSASKKKKHAKNFTNFLLYLIFNLPWAPKLLSELLGPQNTKYCPERE